MWAINLISENKLIAGILLGILLCMAISGVPLSIKKGDLEVKVNMLSGENLDLKFQNAGLARVIECSNGKKCE